MIMLKVAVKRGDERPECGYEERHLNVSFNKADLAMWAMSFPDQETFIFSLNRKLELAFKNYHYYSKRKNYFL